MLVEMFLSVHNLIFPTITDYLFKLTGKIKEEPKKAGIKRCCLDSVVRFLIPTIVSQINAVLCTMNDLKTTRQKPRSTHVQLDYHQIKVTNRCNNWPDNKWKLTTKRTEYWEHVLMKIPIDKEFFLWNGVLLLPKRHSIVI